MAFTSMLPYFKVYSFFCVTQLKIYRVFTASASGWKFLSSLWGMGLSGHGGIGVIQLNSYFSRPALVNQRIVLARLWPFEVRAISGSTRIAAREPNFLRSALFDRQAEKSRANLVGQRQRHVKVLAFGQSRAERILKSI
jgi:hypothetical protein